MRPAFVRVFGQDPLQFFDRIERIPRLPQDQRQVVPRVQRLGRAASACS
jgi:hypothetical protein